VAVAPMASVATTEASFVLKNGFREDIPGSPGSRVRVPTYEFVVTSRAFVLLEARAQAVYDPKMKRKGSFSPFQTGIA
jgi:hypothetical protein